DDRRKRDELSRRLNNRNGNKRFPEKRSEADRDGSAGLPLQRLGLVPGFVHGGEVAVGQIPTRFLNYLLHHAETTLKFPIGVAQALFGIQFQMAGQVRYNKEKIAKLLCDRLRGPS